MIILVELQVQLNHRCSDSHTRQREVFLKKSSGDMNLRPQVLHVFKGLTFIAWPRVDSLVPLCFRINAETFEFAGFFWG
jgi:hypothetical protein